MSGRLSGQSLEKMPDTRLIRDMRTIIIGKKYAGNLTKPLESLGFSVLALPDNPDIDSRLSGHADLSVFNGEDGKIFLAPYLRDSKIPQIVQEYNYQAVFPSTIQSKKYPLDAQFNICSIGNRFLYNPISASDDIIKHLQGQGRVGLEVRQGYTNCSVCVVDDNSVITADRGIIDACKTAGIEVLEINPGYIDLDGFDYGFIGGAAFKIAPKIIAFTGILDFHPDKNKILDFLNLREIQPVFLTEYPLFDIGCAVII